MTLRDVLHEQWRLIVLVVIVLALTAAAETLPDSLAELHWLEGLR